MFNAKGVDFLLVGGYAVVFNGAPRFTGDLDLLIRPESDHVERALTAIRDFRFPASSVTAADLLAQNAVLQLGEVPVQIHLMTSISGLSWDEAWSSRVAGRYRVVGVFFLGKDALITNKRAAGRTKDLTDLEALGA